MRTDLEFNSVVHALTAVATNSGQLLKRISFGVLLLMMRRSLRVLVTSVEPSLRPTWIGRYSRLDWSTSGEPLGSTKFNVRNL